MDKAHQVLNETFGFPAFRLSQEAVVHRLLVDNENALVLFPTGGTSLFYLIAQNNPYRGAGGKSLTFQVPALCLEVRR